MRIAIATSFLLLFLSLAYIHATESKTKTKNDGRVDKKFLTPIEHVIVLMLENRSFDHMLGLLKSKRPEINGCLPDMGPTCSNPLDSLNANPESPVFPVTNQGVNVQISPSHSVHGTTSQIFGFSDPASNMDTSNHTLYNFQREDMQGFIRSYASVLNNNGIKPETVMDCMDSAHLPVLNALVDNYLVFDDWHASLPGPTEPNRCYAIAASSHGMTTNDVYTMAKGLPNKTLFRQLRELDMSWKVYFELVPTTLMFKDMRHRDARQNYHRMSKFYEDVAAGNLPFYTWLEPNYYPSPHRRPDDQHPDHSLADGETLIKNVYEALRRNPEIWEKSVLIVTYDEHGGFFDHVSPPNPVPAPDDMAATTDDPFDFQRLGVRVPTVMISPWVQKQSVASAIPGGKEGGAFEHSSLASTLAHRMFRPELLVMNNNNKTETAFEKTKSETVFKAINSETVSTTTQNNKEEDKENKKIIEVPYLTKRDAWAKTFDHVFLTLDAARSDSDCPFTLPEPFVDARYPATLQTSYNPSQKLNDLQQDLLKIVAGVSLDRTGSLGQYDEKRVSDTWTVEDAYQYIQHVLFQNNNNSTDDVEPFFPNY